MDNRLDIGSRSFRAVMDAQRATSLEELNGVLSGVLPDLGFETMVGIEVSGAGETRQMTVPFAINEPLSWLERYWERRYAAIDPALSELAITASPFFRRELRSLRGALSPEQAEIQEDQRQHGILESLFSPQHHPDGTVTAVVFTASRESDRDPCTRAAAHVVGIYYGLLARKLRAAPPGPVLEIQPVLSRRQLECLHWARLGKSSGDIGDILNLSRRTVDAYMIATCAKLGVKTRIQAVAQAMLLGLLPA